MGLSNFGKIPNGSGLMTANCGVDYSLIVFSESWKNPFGLFTEEAKQSRGIFSKLQLIQGIERKAAAESKGRKPFC